MTDLIQPRHLPLDASIKQAFELLAGAFGMVITIVDDHEVLKGVVTDGDLRKALLEGKSTETHLNTIMNTDPVTIFFDHLDDTKYVKLLRTQLKERGVVGKKFAIPVFAIPVVDRDYKVNGLTNLGMLSSVEQAKSHIAKSPHPGIPRVLVVGGGGYIGSVLVEKIINKGWLVKVLDNLIYSQTALDRFKNNESFSFIKGDVCNLSTQVDAISDVDCVVFLAEIVGDPSLY